MLLSDNGLVVLDYIGGDGQVLRLLRQANRAVHLSGHLLPVRLASIDTLLRSLSIQRSKDVLSGRSLIQTILMD